jgi:hypothetical protein
MYIYMLRPRNCSAAYIIHICCNDDDTYAATTRLCIIDIHRKDADIHTAYVIYICRDEHDAATATTCSVYILCDADDDATAV